MVGPAARSSLAAVGSRCDPRRRGRRACRCVVLVCLQAIPYLSELRIRASQEAAARGDGVAALEAAQSARAIQPWAASPWLQVALVREELGDLQAAESAIAPALDARLVGLAALARHARGCRRSSATSRPRARAFDEREA